MWSGFYTGILDYQKDVDKKKAKLAEKLEKRMEKLITVAAARDASIKKVPTYTSSVVKLKNRLGNVEGADTIVQGITAQSSTAPEILKYIQKVEENRGGVRLSPNEIVEAIEILEIGSAPVTNNYVKTGDYFGSIQMKDLKDLDVYAKGLRQLSTVPTSQEGTFIYETAPVQKFQSEKMKAQNTYLKEGIVSELTSVAITGMKKEDGSFRTRDGQPIDREMLNLLKSQGKDDLIDLSKVQDDDGKYLFGLDTVKKALDLGTPQFDNVLQRNSAFQSILLNQIPQDRIRRLIDTGSGSGSQEQQIRNYFDDLYGRGAAMFILNRFGV